MIINLNEFGTGGGVDPQEVQEIVADYTYSKAEVDENLEAKQDTLVSGTSIKTINGESVLGSGDIVVVGDETDPIWTAEKENYYTKGETDGLVGDVKSTAETAYNVAQDASSVASTAESKADDALTKLDGKADKDEIPSLDGYATEQWVGEQGYLTEHQQLKTINGETIVGEGNIEIQGGGDETDPIWTAEKVNYYTKDDIDSKLGDLEIILKSI